MSNLSVTALAVAALACGASEARASEPAAVSPITHTVDSRPTGPVTRATTVIALAELPEGQLLDEEWKGRPAALPAGGKIDGVRFKRVVQTYGKRSQVVITMDDPDVSHDDGTDRDEVNASARCFDTASEDSRGERLAEEKKNIEDFDPAADEVRSNERWAAGMNSSAQVRRSQMADGSARNDRVQQLHIEELVTTPQGLALDSRDVWVDASTGGARLRAKARLPLRDLGVSPVGIHLYAARVVDQVVFVARQTKGASSVFAGRKDDTTQSMSCGHISLRLDVKRGLSEMGTLQALAKIEDEDDKRAAEAKAEKAKTEEGPPAADPQSFTRTRLGRIIVSSTWEPGDPGPLVSFSAGWADRARTE